MSHNIHTSLYVLRKAVGDSTPSRTATMIVIPVLRNGTEKSILEFRAGVLFSDVMHRSAL